MAYKNNGGATSDTTATSGMNYDSIPFKNSAIDMLKLKEFARNQGMKMERTLKPKPMGFMDRVRNR